MREGLNAPYRSVQAHCARALGTLGDTESTPILLERIKRETDIGLRIAYAAALGKLEVVEAAGDILTHLHERRDKSARKELALAVARLVGEEHHFIQLLRQAESDLGTTAAQAVITLGEGEELVQECADAFAHGQVEKGVELLIQLIRGFSVGRPDMVCAQVLQACADGMDEFGAQRVEYLILALHALECRLESK